MVLRDDIIAKRMKDTLSPAEEAKIPIGFGVRDRVYKSLQHRITYRELLDRNNSYRITLAGLLIAAPALAGATVWAITDPESLSMKMLFDNRLMFAAFILTFGFLVLAARGAVQSRRSHKHNVEADKDVDKNFANEKNAQYWSKVAKRVLENCAAKEVVEPLKAFAEDKHIPYRILTKYLPAPMFELRRPEAFVEDGLKNKAARDKKLFEIDSLCGGALSFLGAMPKPRYSTTSVREIEPVVHDLYWRHDVQEVADADQADVFLRFHQSVIEEDIDSTCFYKTFATLNNFRQTKIFVLLVRDVVDCLINESGDFDPEDHANIYKNLPSVSEANIIDLLCENKYCRFPPRIERVSAKAYTPKIGPVLFPGQGRDWAMLFDPARVWVERESDQPNIEALVALRLAIHLVSRTKTIGIDLKKRDLLIVDNRRALVARQEDRPGFSLRDVIAGCDESLEGRWTRKIYAFRGEGNDGSDNFRRVEVSLHRAVNATPVEDSINRYSLLPESLKSSTCGDVAFDYGFDPAEWPRFLT
ncbi:MAG: hypothetical protein AAF936_11915 [Pseudomonadota bacterium]